MDINSKKISPDQFKQIARKLPEIRSQTREIQELARAKPEMVKEFFGDDFAWSEIYELPYEEQIAMLLTLLDIHKPFIEASKAAQPYEATIKLSEDGGELDRLFMENEENIDKQYLLWMVVVLQRNVLSIMLHHQSLGALVEEVRKGNDEAFFKAVSIDRSILSCTTFANRLARAELFGDKTFFIHLRKALKGPSAKHMATIGDVRYGIVLLREAGFDSFTDDQLIQFFVANRLYPNTYNAAKNLRKHIQVAKRFART